MAFSSTMVFEIRSSATASNVNSGGFNPSNGAGNTTDYSQQDAAQYAYTDLASSDGTSASPTVTSASHTFDSNDVGNTIRISAGASWTVGVYEIMSVAAGGAVLDRACGSAATLSGGTWKEGGAFSLGFVDDTIFELAVPGNKFWVKNGSYTLGGAVTLSNPGTSTNPIAIEGYDTTRGDRPTGSARPLFDCGASIFVTQASWRIYHMQYTGTGAGTLTLSSSNIITFSKIVNTSTTANRNALTPGANSKIFACELISYRGVAIATGNSVNVIGCYIHDSNIGASHASTSSVLTMFYCIFANCVTASINCTVGNNVRSLVMGNTFWNGESDKLGTAIDLVAGVVNWQVVNNIFYGFTTGISHADAGQLASFDDYNNYYNNTTDTTNWTKGASDIALDPEFTDVDQLTGTTATTSGSVLTDSGADFTDVVAGQDFLYLVSGTGITAGVYGIVSKTTDTITLDIAPGTNATADKVYRILIGRNFEVGTNMKAAGFPGVFPAGLTTGYVDIGAAQREEPEGGGYSRGRVVNP